MPVNFSNLDIYRINYSKLFKHFTSIDIFENRNTQEKYIAAWIETLKKLDETLTYEFNTPNKKAIFSTNAIKNNEFEVFQQPVFYGGIKIVFHFRVSMFKEIVKSESNIEPFKIPMSEFTSTNSQFKWNPVITDSKYSLNKDPVFMVPFLQGQYNYLVIDGNHRISSFIKASKKEIDTLILSEQSILDLDILASAFDKYLYIFHNELHHIANKRQQQNLTDLELLNMSYINNHTFKFD